MIKFFALSRIKLSLLSVLCTASVLSFPNETVGVPELAWEKKELKVCWQTDLSRLKQDVGEWALYNYEAWPASSALQNEVRTAVQNTYTNTALGISFQGFTPCPTEPVALSQYSVYLVNHIQIRDKNSSSITESASGVSVVGDQNQLKKPKSIAIYGADKRNSGMPYLIPNTNIKMVQWKSAVGLDLDEDSLSAKNHLEEFRYGIERAMGFKPKEKVAYNEQKRVRKLLEQESALLEKDARRFTILHEFGHVLGLLHEDRRHDAEMNRPRFCTNIASDADRENDGSIGAEENRFGTEYDPFSIMSYCRSTMHTLYREAEITCALSSIIEKRILNTKRLNERERESIRDFLKECPTLRTYPFSVGITARDLNSLNQMYLGKTSLIPDAINYRASEREIALIKLFEKTTNLPFINKNPSR